MENILFITTCYFDSLNGGSLIARRDENILRTLCREGSFYTYFVLPRIGKDSLTMKIHRLQGIIRGFMGALTEEKIDEVATIIKEKNIKKVFLENSQIGLLAKFIKKRFPYVEVFCYFQNIEYDFVSSTVIKGHDYKHLFWISLCRKNEKMACFYSDKVFVLNQRDKQRMEELYKRKADNIIPVTSPNDYIPSPQTMKQLTNKRPQALFIGSYFPGNTIGLKWFCEEVMPLVQSNLCIVGSGMKNFESQIKPSTKISIHDSVPDLQPFYEAADFVVLPITTGGGMKVKTAESLKFGKYIIGTPEAFQGYNITSDVAKICNNKDEFVKAINGFHNSKKYNAPSRELSLTHNSHENVEEIFKRLLV